MRLPKKILITGGPGSGKTTLINELRKRKFECREEIVRNLTLKGKNEGEDQLFLKKPLEFSQSIMKLRVKQFYKKSNNKLVFFDRGVHEVVAYLNFINFENNNDLLNQCKNIKYDSIFVLEPWEKIFISDDCRYETYEESVMIFDEILKIYNYLKMEVQIIEKNSVQKRVDIILNHLKNYL